MSNLIVNDALIEELFKESDIKNTKSSVKADDYEQNFYNTSLKVHFKDSKGDYELYAFTEKQVQLLKELLILNHFKVEISTDDFCYVVKVKN